MGLVKLILRSPWQRPLKIIKLRSFWKNKSSSATEHALTNYKRLETICRISVPMKCSPIHSVQWQTTWLVLSYAHRHPRNGSAKARKKHNIRFSSVHKAITNVLSLHFVEWGQFAKLTVPCMCEDKKVHVNWQWGGRSGLGDCSSCLLSSFFKQQWLSSV